MRLLDFRSTYKILFTVDLKYSGFLLSAVAKQGGILKGEVSLYCWPPVWLVENQLYENWQFLFLLAKPRNPNQSNRSSTVQWYFPLLFPIYSLVKPMYSMSAVSMCILWSTICGLYYKHVMIVNDDSSIINKFRTSLTDNTRVVIYDCHMFIVQATGVQNLRRENLKVVWTKFSTLS